MAQFMNNNSKTNEHVVIDQFQVNQNEFFSAMSAMSDLAVGTYSFLAYHNGITSVLN